MNKLIKYLQFNNKESPVFMPNEIFGDLKKSVKNKHVPFAYSYYYLCTWLYRYLKHMMIGIDNKGMKEVLGYSPTYQPIDYIIKKNGVLDQMGYTSTEKDFPTRWELNGSDIGFEMLSEEDKVTKRDMMRGKSRKYTVKCPIKAFHRHGDDDVDGTFYDPSNTHEVPFEVFLFCMSNDNIGCTGFYLWSYLKMKNQIFEGGYDVGLSDLSVETRIAKSTMCKYLGLLRQHRMINCYYNQEFFCVAMKDDDKKANTYVTNEYEKFTDRPISYEKMKVIKKEEYFKMVEKDDRESVGEWNELFG